MTQIHDAKVSLFENGGIAHVLDLTAPTIHPVQSIGYLDALLPIEQPIDTAGK